MFLCSCFFILACFRCRHFLPFAHAHGRFAISEARIVETAYRIQDEEVMVFLEIVSTVERLI